MNGYYVFDEKPPKKPLPNWVVNMLTALIMAFMLLASLFMVKAVVLCIQAMIKLNAGG